MSHTLPNGKDEGSEEGARMQRGEVTKAAGKMETSSRLGRTPLVRSAHLLCSKATENPQVLLFVAADTDAGALGQDDSICAGDVKAFLWLICT